MAARNSARTTLVQALGGLFFLVTIFFTWQQIQVSRQQQITERFTRAIDQLGNADDAVRVGGIYALERIANESKTDREAINHTLVAYVRARSPWQGTPTEAISQESKATTSNPTSTKPENAKPESRPPSCPERTQQIEHSHMQTLGVRHADIQSVLEVIGHLLSRDHELEAPDLQEIDLRVAILYDVRFSGATLSGSNLEGANLDGANFDGAFLDYNDGAYCPALLDWASFEDSSFKDADLSGASLIGSDLDNAHLEGADLYKANLSGSYLRGAHLKDAKYLEQAVFKGAKADSDTTWPKGFDWKAAGVIMES
jgi:uncharacterized protein YjbI with pentapeptide repeats